MSTLMEEKGTLFSTPENLGTSVEALEEMIAVSKEIEKNLKKQSQEKAKIKRLLQKSKRKAKKKGLLKRFWAALKRKIKSAISKSKSLLAKLGRGIKALYKRVAKSKALRVIKDAVVYVGTPILVGVRWLYQGAAMVVSGVSLAVAAAVISLAGLIVLLVTFPFRGKKGKKAKGKGKPKAKKSTSKKTETVVEVKDEDIEKKAREILGDEAYEQTVKYVTEQLGQKVDSAPSASVGVEVKSPQQPKGRPTPKQAKTNRRHHGPRDHTPRRIEDSELPPF